MSMRSVITDEQITAGAAVLCGCTKPQPIGRIAAIEVFDAMAEAAHAAKAQPSDMPDVLAKIDKALQTVADLCEGRIKWTMRVPAEPDRDPDLIIAGALSAARAAIATGVPEGVIALLREIRPTHGAVGSRDVEVTEQQRRIDAAIAMLAAAPSADAQSDSADAIRQLIAQHAEQREANPYCYFELAYTRQTGWMAWLCSNARESDPNRKILAKGQGDTPDEACRAAIDASAEKGGAA